MEWSGRLKEMDKRSDALIFNWGKHLAFLAFSYSRLAPPPPSLTPSPYSVESICITFHLMFVIVCVTWHRSLCKNISLFGCEFVELLQPWLCVYTSLNVLVGTVRTVRTDKRLGRKIAKPRLQYDRKWVRCIINIICGSFMPLRERESNG